ncbi:MAG: lipocalin-like domain-containing protein [Pseudomonadota bacterium]|nr:lipocalin-like domain-containing protein [Pseudomonadota bacterium]
MTRQQILAVWLSLAVGCTVAVQSSQAADSSPSIAAHGVSAQLVGGWSLKSRVTTTADGKTLVDPGLSVLPNGVLIYDAYGHVAAQLSRAGRTVDMLGDECRKAMEVKGTNDTSQTILGYDAYFGTYTVDEKQGIVTHHLESALFPSDIGKSIIRHFTIAGDILTIKFTTTLGDGTPVTRTLVFSRLK